MLREHEKFWAFIALGAGVLILALLAMFHTPSNDMAYRIVDAAMGGFLLALGASANALFRIGTQVENDNAAAARAVAETQLRDTPQKSEIVNTPQQPAVVQEVQPQPAPEPVQGQEPPATAEDLPPMLRS